MFPISAIPQALSTYGLQPQLDVTAPELASKLPGMNGVSETLTPKPPGVDGASEVLTTTQPAGDAFGSLLGKFIEDVNSKQVNAGNAVASLQAGGNVSLHQAVIAMEEANVSFQLMVEVRNKLLDAYQELMRMQV